MAGVRVPGYDVVQLLGRGASGGVWLAREQASGEPVALKRLRRAPGSQGRGDADRLGREAAILAGVTHPHVLRLRAGVRAEDGDLVLVMDHAAGGSLARLITVRQRLTPGEVVTIATPLAQALAEAHRRGVVHGDVTPANVLFDADGRPLLADLGVASLVGVPVTEVRATRGFTDPAVSAGARPQPASDVYGLAAVCVAALTGHVPGDDIDGRAAGLGLPPDTPAALAEVLERALSPDPVERPTAAEVAGLVYGSVAAAPVRLGLLEVDTVTVDDIDPAAVTRRVRPAPVASAATDAPRRGRRRRARPSSRAFRRRLVRGTGVVAAAVLVLAAAVLLGLVWAADGSSSRASAVASPQQHAGATVSRTGPVATPWREVLTRLDARRSASYARADPRMLSGVYAPGAPARARDLARLRELARAGLHARGLHLSPTSVAVVRHTGSRVVVRVVDVMSPYDLVSRDDVVVDRRRGRPAMAWRVSLLRVGRSYRIYDVERSS